MQEYGTHYMQKASMGASYWFTVSFDSNTSEKTRSDMKEQTDTFGIKVGASGKGGGGSVGHNTSETKKQEKI